MIEDGGPWQGMDVTRPIDRNDRKPPLPSQPGQDVADRAQTDSKKVAIKVEHYTFSGEIKGAMLGCAARINSPMTVVSSVVLAIS
jgi:hypothetical protein